MTEETEPVQIPVPNTSKAKRFIGYKHVMDSLNIWKEDEFFIQVSYKDFSYLHFVTDKKLSEDLKSLQILVPTGQLFNFASLNKVYN